MDVKIKKYRKLKNNKYRLTLDNGKMCDLYDEVILNNDLLLNNHIKDIEPILDENMKLDAYYKALWYIGVRFRSEKEVRLFLSKSYEWNIILPIVERLKREGYIDDEKLVDAFISDRLRMTLKGYYSIVNDLELKGIDKSIICFYLDKIDNETWFQRAKKIAEKKVKGNKSYGHQMLKEKIRSDLGRMGYSKDIIMKVLYNIDIEPDNDILRKNFRIYYRKYSRKYQGNELYSRIFKCLVAKGFRYDDIKKIANQEKM